MVLSDEPKEYELTDSELSLLVDIVRDINLKQIKEKYALEIGRYIGAARVNIARSKEFEMYLIYLMCKFQLGTKIKIQPERITKLLLNKKNKMEANKFNIIFIGTDDFSIISLKKLLDLKYNIICIITSPGKSKIKQYSKNLNIPILQPNNLEDIDFINHIKEFNPDLQIVVSFKKLPEKLWSIPKYGTINLHPSLLPDYRGAAPINWSIINGETITGVTTFFINNEIDKGQIILQEKTCLPFSSTYNDLLKTLGNLGSSLLIKSLDYIENPPNHKYENSSNKLAPKLTSSNTKINWNNTVTNIYNFIRGLNSYPGAWTILNNKIVKLYDIEMQQSNTNETIGTFISDNKTYLKVACIDGYINIKSIQMEGRKKLSIEKFLIGYKNINKYKFI